MNRGILPALAGLLPLAQDAGTRRAGSSKVSVSRAKLHRCANKPTRRAHVRSQKQLERRSRKRTSQLLQQRQKAAAYDLKLGQSHGSHGSSKRLISPWPNARGVLS